MTGTLCAGKGSVLECLVEAIGVRHCSVRAYQHNEIRKRRWPESRDSMVMGENELRGLHGPSYVTDQLYFEAAREGKNCIIESIRTPGEIDSLRKKGRFFLFAVDADPKLRYERIVARSSETDDISFSTFIENENREMNASDPNKQNLKACIGQADFVISNDGSKEELFLEVEKILGQIT